MRIRTNYLVSKFILRTFIPLIIPLCYLLLVYIFNIISLSDFLEITITSFAIIFAIYTFLANQRDMHNNKVDEQIYLIEGLLAELSFIQENINWYKKDIEDNVFLKLDHQINRIYIENYLARLNGKFFNKIGFANISNINDKITQLNSRVSEGRELYLIFQEKNIPPQKRFNREYCLKIIKEVLPKIDALKNELEKQKKILKEKEKI